MVAVDYGKIDDLLRSRGWSRRKLALSISVNPGSFAGSFRRHSRMNISYVWKIADCLFVPAKSLIDRSAYPTEAAYQADVKAVENGRSDHAVMVEDTQILQILHVLRNLNAAGLRKALSLVELLNEVPKLQKSPAEVMADQERKEADYLQMEREEERAQLALEYDADLKALEAGGTTEEGI